MSVQSSEVLRVKAPVLRWSISARPNSESRWRSARPTAPTLASGARVRQRQLGQVAGSRTVAMVAASCSGPGGVRRTAPARPGGARASDSSSSARWPPTPDSSSSACGARVGQLQLGPGGAYASDRSSSGRWSTPAAWQCVNRARERARGARRSPLQPLHLGQHGERLPGSLGEARQCLDEETRPDQPCWSAMDPAWITACPSGWRWAGAREGWRAGSRGR